MVDAQEAKPVHMYYVCTAIYMGKYRLYLHNLCKSRLYLLVESISKYVSPYMEVSYVH